MKVKNTSKHRYCHAKLDENYKLQMLILKPNEIKEVPDEIAASWVKGGEVIEYVEPKEVKKLADENEALKKELEKLKKANDCQECYEDNKTPSEDDCENCDKKDNKPNKTQKKQSKTKSKNK
jgi:hypothetical protein